MRTLKSSIPAAAALATLLGATPALAYKWQLGEHTSLNVNYLLQVGTQFAQDAAPSGADWSKDFYLRRSRFLISGDVYKNISFFVDFEQANVGKGGDWASPLYFQDAFMSFKVVDEFIVDAGMLLLPFSRFNMQGAGGLSGLDYHSSMIKLVDGSTKNWRDAGVQIRGYAFEKKLQYRVGVFNGSQALVLQKDAAGAAVVDDKKKSVLTSNPTDIPRLTGHVRYNILGSEADFFAKGIYFASEPILSIGAGVDFVYGAGMNTPAELDPTTKAVTTPGTRTYALGVNGDVFVDIPFGGEEKNHEVVFQGAFFWYRHGNELKYDSAGASTVVPHRNSGLGVATEVGYRWKFLEPVFAADWFKSDQANADLLSLRGGMNFFIQKHQASVKIEGGATRTGSTKADGSATPFKGTVTAQAQILF